MIKKIVSTSLLGVAAMIGLALSSQSAQGVALPAIFDFLPTAQLALPKCDSGPDGNTRFLWDIFNIGPGTYGGSNLWILDPTGNVIGSGDTMVPASVGGANSASTILSFTQLHVNSDNSTTLAFEFGGGVITGGKVGAFGTWTYDAQGKLIAFSGPTGFSHMQIANIKFVKDFLVVTFLPENQKIINTFGLNNGPYTVWVIDHFGNVVSAVGPQGPYTNYALGTVTLPGPSSAPNQLWHWISVVGTTGIDLSVQEFSPSGAALNGFVYGPF